MIFLSELLFVKTTTISWTTENGPNIHAQVARVENRIAEVIRAYEGEWFVCAYVDDHMCKALDEFTGYETFAAAKSRAERFLKGETTFIPWDPPVLRRGIAYVGILPCWLDLELAQLETHV